MLANAGMAVTPIAMKKLMLLALLAPAAVFAATPHDAATLRDAALKDDVAWDIVEGLTTEVGQRLAGTEAEARARTWAVTRLNALGFKNVRIEPYQMPVWVRGVETGEIIAPFPHKLALTAIGNSGATPASGLEAEVVLFPTIADLEAVPDGSLKGKIAYVGNAMKRAQDGSSYRYYGTARFVGPNIAAKKGAAALVIRSIGTDHHRLPHTGNTRFDAGVTPIPAAALSVPDAENLERVFARGKVVRMKLVLTPRNIGTQESGNVIAEVPGSDPAAGMIVIGGHLDSWDLATGAIDDAAGVAITAAAAKRIMDAGTPRRTIRVVWFGSEEVGGFGGRDYLRRHGSEPHALTGESDFGSDRVWRFNATVNDAAKPVLDRIETALFPLGITRGKDAAEGGADIRPLVTAGVPVIDLNQDGTRYFDIHHTPDDTLDKVDPEQLRQNVAAWTAVLAVAANAPESIGKQ